MFTDAPPVTTDSSIDLPCAASQFECGTGMCIDIGLRCDSFVDCADGSDERDCHGEQAGHSKGHIRSCIEIPTLIEEETPLVNKAH